MALDAFLDSNYSRAMPPVSRSLMQSSGSSNLLHKDEQFQGVVASFSSKASRNLPCTDVGISNFNLDKYCNAANQTAVHSDSSLAYDIAESYLVPEGNSAFSKVPRLHRTCTANIDSRVDFFKLPVLSSHDLNRSKTSVNNASSFAVQDISYMNDSRVRKRKQQPGSLTATSHRASQKHEDSLPHDIKQELYHSCLKKPRLDLNQDIILCKYIIKQLMESQDSVQVQGQMALLKELLQQNKLQNEQKEFILQKLPQFQGVEVKQNARQQIGHHFRQPDICQAPAVHHFDGVCSRRLMQYVYHLRHRPPENGIAYWRKFVEEYYSPHAKKRWCFSLYDNVGYPSSGVFPQAAVAQWHCDLCGSTSGRGFEVTSEVLPMLNKVSFESGVIDEILFLDMPCEHRFPSGLMVLEYEKAVQESVYERFRVVREGKLRIIFAYDLKILSWEFCSRHHEELLQRSFIVPQVSRLVNAAQKYQSTINGSIKVSPHDLQEDCSRFLTTGCQLVRNFELQLIDDLGFSKRFIRCLQIAGVVESMRDLMTFSRDNKIGPVEALKKYPRQTTSIDPLRGEGKEKLPLERVQSPPSHCNELMPLSPDFNNSSNGSLNTTCNPHPIVSKEEAHKKLLRQTLTSNASKWKEALSHKCNGSKAGASTKPFRCPKTSSLGLCEDLLVTDLSSYNFSESSKNIQEHMIQKWLREMVSSSRVENKADKERLNQGIGSTTPTSGLQTKAIRTDKLTIGLDCDNMVSTAAASTNLCSTHQTTQNGSAASIRDSSWCFSKSWLHQLHQKRTRFSGNGAEYDS
ncbi:hypothetical protein PTKIN_Ptkin04bG0193800 [Pterospermum kingtungense]